MPQKINSNPKVKTIEIHSYFCYHINMRSKNETKYIILSILLIILVIVCSLATLFMLVGTIVCLADNSFGTGYVYLGITITLAVFFLSPAIIILCIIKKKHQKRLIQKSGEEDKIAESTLTDIISKKNDNILSSDIVPQEDIVSNKFQDENGSIDKEMISAESCSHDEMNKMSSPICSNPHKTEKQKRRLIFKIWRLNNAFDQTMELLVRLAGLLMFVFGGIFLIVDLFSNSDVGKAITGVLIPLPLLAIVIIMIIHEKDFSKQFNSSTIEDLTIIFQNLKNEIKLKKKNKKVTTTYNSAISIKDLSDLTPIEFEKYCAVFLMNNGYKNVKLTKTTGDFGADIIARNPNGEMVACQCKYYTKPVGVKAIQEVYSSLVYYHCQKGIVFAINGYTTAAKELAIKTGVLLYDMGRNLVHDLKTKSSDWVELLDVIDDIFE